MYKSQNVLVLLSVLLITLMGLSTQAQAFSVQENQPRGTVVGTVTINDNNGNYSLGGTDVNHFSINSSTGVLTTSSVFDYESRTSYSVIVTRAVFEPEILVAAKSVSISITNDLSDDVAEPPQQQPQPQKITEVPEPEGRTPVEQTPEPQMSGGPINFNVRENLPIGKGVGQPVSISLEGIPQNRRNQAIWVMWGAGSIAFSINKNTGQLKTAEVLDYERQSTYDLVLSKSYVSPIGAPEEVHNANEMKHIRVTVIDTPEAPSSSMPVPTYPDRPVKDDTRYLSVRENRPVGTTLTFFGVTNPAQIAGRNRAVYALEGEDAGAFKLVPGASNRFNIVTAKVFDYETKARYSFRSTFMITSGTGTGNLGPIVLFIVDIMDDTSDNFPPTSPADPNVQTFSFNENQPVGTTVGRVTTSASGNDWALGGPDVNDFSITSSGDIKSRTSFDYEAQNRYKLIVYKGTLPASLPAVKNVKVNITQVVPTYTVGQLIPGFPKQTSRTWGSYYGETITENGVTYHCTPPQQGQRTCNVLNRQVKRGTVSVVQAAPSAPIALAWEDAKRRAVQLRTGQVPKETKLLANYPNPFNPETWIPYRLAEAAEVALTIYDADGQVVRTIDVGHRTAAVYESRSKAIHWDGKNAVGEQVASGVYFYQFRAGDYTAMRKMVILK